MLNDIQKRAIWLAIHCVENAAERWKQLIDSGRLGDDARLRGMLADEFGGGGGIGAKGCSIAYKGGDHPAITLTLFQPGTGDEVIRVEKEWKRAELLAAVRTVLAKPPENPWGHIRTEPQGQSIQHSESNIQNSPTTTMQRLQTFGGTPSIPSIPSKRAPRTTAKAKCVKPDAKTNTAAHTAHGTTASKGKPAAPKGTTAKLIRDTPAHVWSALAPSRDAGMVRTCFASYATANNLDGHWRLHWNAYLAFRAQIDARPDQTSTEASPAAPVSSTAQHIAESATECAPVAHVSREIAEAFGMADQVLLVMARRQGRWSGSAQEGMARLS